MDPVVLLGYIFALFAFVEIAWFTLFFVNNDLMGALTELSLCLPNVMVKSMVKLKT